MAGSLNRVELLGNVGKDPEIRHTQDGRPVVNFSIATSESWKDKSTGEKREKTDWHRVVCFNEGLCGVIEKYVSKGSKIWLEGKLVTRKYQAQDGSDRYSTEVVLENFNGRLILLGGKGGDGDSGGEREQRSSAPAGRADTGSTRDLDDEVPF